MIPSTSPEACDCYECVGSEYEYTDDGHRFVINNFKYHTFLEPCDGCGRPKTESLDLGRKGYYVCWWCHDRAADGPLSEAHNSAVRRHPL